MAQAANPHSDDYYQVLGLSRNAQEADIKKAYRKLAVRYHPDKNPDDKENCEAIFKKVGEAYEVLSDPQKRSAYDTYGKAAFEGGGGGGGGGGFDGGGGGFGGFSNGGFGGFSSFPQGFRASFGPGGGSRFQFHDAHDIFAQFFGGRDPFAAFDDDPFFSSRSPGGMGGMQSQSFGGNGMRSMQSQSFGGGMGGSSMGFSMGFGSGGGGFSSFSSSSSSSRGGPGGTSKSVKKTTSNGVTTVETTIRDANGKVTTSREQYPADSGGGGVFGGFVSNW
mmetsp:Transcript_28725/g.58819  ORF Transcript_28725/g.58819 Transcript_28725/m.58819 type:complete len:277 (-) Transcript_28725:183-1013(-)|eukprot:CAMPEP_0181346786 /NCGR_PEP_ID=MMETSP1101-20121128/33516_1 /TAXON_ID=46948 /ORGANISM="Rhodomonas abbreviata, Strain Caron Lab Isolate" /LENGTH=276 /DNA_ID=CAMNT_0023458927 /DNA_START=47 /DNA_END=877 /DNA_ORIENTATION=+